MPQIVNSYADQRAAMRGNRRRNAKALCSAVVVYKLDQTGNLQPVRTISWRSLKNSKGGVK